MKLFNLHRISLLRLTLVINIFYIVGVFGGSAIYILTSALSLQNILLLPAIVVNFAVIKKMRFVRAQLVPLVILCAYVLIVTVVTILSPNIGEGIKPMLYQYHMAAIYMVGLTSPQLLGNQLQKIAKVFVTIWFVWATMQGLYFLGVLPSSFSFLFYRTNHWVSDFHDGIQINGPFNNGNDFGTIALLVLLFIVNFLKRRRLKNVFVCMAAVIVCLAMSRTALALLIALIPLMQWATLHVRRAVRIVGIMACIVISLIATRSLWQEQIMESLERNYGYSAITINFNRMTSILNLWDKTNHVVDGSAVYRTASYKYAVPKLTTHFAGTGYQNYKSFYLEGGFRSQLIWRNPHSFFIEVGIAYGLPALLCMLTFLAAMGYYAIRINGVKKSDKRFFAIIMAYSIILSNVPSSILLVSVFWLPLILSYCYLTSKGHRE